MTTIARVPGGATGRARKSSGRGRPSESQIQRAVVRWLDFALPRHEALWFAVPNGGMRDKRVAQHLKAEGVQSGVADIIIIWRGRAIACELKAEKGRQSESQKAWADQLTLAGGVYFVARSVDDLEARLDAIGIPLRARTRSAVGGVPAE
jgi:hypothetical protein